MVWSMTQRAPVATVILAELVRRVKAVCNTMSPDLTPRTRPARLEAPVSPGPWEPLYG
ncbi:MAG: hypothetical protein ACRDFB_06345 [Rhabdochlamydiaceae bacterium]